MCVFLSINLQHCVAVCIIKVHEDGSVYLSSFLTSDGIARNILGGKQEAGLEQSLEMMC